MKDLPGLLEEGRKNGLLESSAANTASLLASHPEEYERESIAELAQAGNWEELNNRFFRTLAFGTGGCAAKRSARQSQPPSEDSRRRWTVRNFPAQARMR